MERLTKWLNDKKNLCIKECEKECVEKYTECHKCEPFKDVIKRLADYEDAEEQGLLLRLPCKVGDKAYYVHKGGIDEVEVDSFVLNINLFVNVSYYIGCDRFGKTLTPYKTLFFTKEEAEQALANMKDERNGR